MKKLRKVLSLILVAMLVAGAAAATTSTSVYAAKKTKKVVVKEGTTFTSGNLKYKVTSVKSAKKTGEASVTGTKTKKVATVTIPKTATYKGYHFTVTAIGKNAFKNCSKLKKINIKSTKITKVGKDAFKGINKNAVISVWREAVANVLKGRGQKSSVTIVDSSAKTETTAAAEPEKKAEEEQEAAEAPEATTPAPEEPKADETPADPKIDEPVVDEQEVTTPDPEVSDQEVNGPEIADPQADEQEDDENEVVKPEANEAKVTEQQSKSEEDLLREHMINGNHTFKKNGPEMHEATCSSNAYKIWKCDTDGCSATRIVEFEGTALGHQWGEEPVVTPGNCQKFGHRTWTCTRQGCSATKTEETAKGNHKIEEVVVKEPTCTEKGEKILKCTVEGCNYQTTVKESIESTEHKWGNDEVIKSTCEKGGYTKQTCTVCGATRKINVTKATEHQWSPEEKVYCTIGDGKNKVEMGTKKTCSACGAAEYKGLNGEEFKACVLRRCSDGPHIFCLTHGKEAFCEHDAE